MTAVGRLVISRLLNFAAGLERVYDPFLFPVLGTKESIKKGKTIFAIQLAVYIYQKYIQCRFIYLFVLYSEISDRFPENGGNRYGSAPALREIINILALALSDYWKAYDMIPHSWIVKCLEVFEIAENCEKVFFILMVCRHRSRVIIIRREVGSH